MAFKEFGINNEVLNRIKGAAADFQKHMEELKEKAKQEGIKQLQSSFTQVTTSPRACGSRGVNVEVEGKSFFVKGTPKYLHNINEGTYSLQSVEYTVSENKNGMTQDVTGDDYLNNIVENKAIGANADIKQLQDQLSKIMSEVNAKLDKLRQLENAISGKGNLIASLGFEAVDPNSPDAAATLAKQIEEATKKSAELDKQIQEKTTEYYKKTEQVMQAKEKAKEIDEKYDKALKLYNDLCEHYGIENNMRSEKMLASNRNDLDSLLTHYENYIKMQEKGIARIDEAIKNTKGTPEEIDTDVARTTDDKSGTKYLENLKNKAKSIDEKYNKAMQLYNDLSEHYGIRNIIPLEQMEAPDRNADIETLVKHYESYIQMQKRNIDRINKVIDELQSPEQKSDDIELILKELDSITPAKSIFAKSGSEIHLQGKR